MNQINAVAYYDTYHGHEISYLKIIKNYFSQYFDKIVYFAGDSSLDNKYWINNSSPAINGYGHILNPPTMKKDLCYHLSNCLIGNDIGVINTAIEATTLEDRKTSILSQDCFIRDNIRSHDILIISIGGNDIALKPSLKTILNMACLVYLNSTETIKTGPDNTWGMNYFINIFKNDIKIYIEKLIEKTIPEKIIVCTIYYPDEKSTGSWADKLLGYIGYDKDPTHLQEIIKQIHKYAISQIKIDGVQIISYPMYKTLNGKNTNDYVQRVEPSDVGGNKIAKKLSELILK